MPWRKIGIMYVIAEQIIEFAKSLLGRLILVDRVQMLLGQARGCITVIDLHQLIVSNLILVSSWSLGTF